MSTLIYTKYTPFAEYELDSRNFITINIPFNGKIVGTMKYDTACTNQQSCTRKDDEVSFFALNHLGTPVVVSDFGTTTQVIKRDEWGNILANSYDNNLVTNTSVGYTNQRQDADTQNTYIHARYLSNANKVWLSVDPMSITNFSSDIFLINPQLQNMYSYATNNPIMNIDPDGKMSDEVAGIQAQQVYIDGHEGDGLSSAQEQGWKYDYSMNVLGMKASVYRRYDQDGNAVEQSIAFRGSRLSPLKDPGGTISDWALNNATQPFGLSPNAWTAIYLTKKVMDANPGLKTSCTGNSKGGAECANSAQWNNIEGFIFNPAPIGYYNKDYQGNGVKDYTVNGEILSRVFGVSKNPNVTVIALPYTDYSVNYGSNMNPINLVKNIASKINSSAQNHLMPTVNKVLPKTK